MVERKHRQIVETGITLMAYASLPFEYWDHAFQASVHLINRLPTSALNFETPYHKLYNAHPDYGFLRVFGCSCFPLLRPYNQHKLQFRSEECLFLGYSTSHKGYKCQASSGRIFISKVVVFNEHKFPYKQLMLTDTSPSAPTSFVSPNIPVVASPRVRPSHPPGFPPMPTVTNGTPYASFRPFLCITSVWHTYFIKQFCCQLFKCFSLSN